jgi:hypothetical protein
VSLGVTQLNATCPLAGVATTLVGLEDTAIGVAEVIALAPVPPAVNAETRKKYGTPLVSEPTVAVVEVDNVFADTADHTKPSVLFSILYPLTATAPARSSGVFHVNTTNESPMVPVSKRGALARP